MLRIIIRINDCRKLMCVDFDEEKVEEVLDYLNVVEEQVSLKPIRLGKRGLPGGKPRLMKATLNNVNTKKQVLSKAKTLRTCRDEEMSLIYITRDMTPKEREESRKLRDELKRRLDGEHVMIRGGKIVPDNLTTKKHSFRDSEKGKVQGGGST